MPFLLYSSLYFTFCWSLHKAVSSINWLDAAIIKTVCELFNLYLVIVKPYKYESAIIKYYEILLVLTGHGMFLAISYIIDEQKKINFAQNMILESVSVLYFIRTLVKQKSRCYFERLSGKDHDNQ